MTPNGKQNSIKDSFWTLNGSKYLRRISEPSAFSDAKKCLVSVGLHAYQEQSKDIETFRDELKSKGLNVLLIIIYPTRDPKTIGTQLANDTLHICLKDLSYWGTPKKALNEKIKQFKADIFINLNSQFSYIDMGLALFSEAPYRISSYQLPYKRYFNVLLKSNLNQLHNYFNQIKDLFSHLT